MKEPLDDERTLVILRAARAAAWHYRHSMWMGHISWDDLVQIAAEGAVRGHRRYDPARGAYRACLRAHALGAVSHWLRDHSQLMRAPRHHSDAWRARIPVDSLDTALWHDGTTTVGDRVVDGSSASSLHNVELRNLIATLAPALRVSVFLYYFADITQEHIAALMHVSQKHVHRMLQKAVTHLREAMA